MAKRLHMTNADYVAIAISPALIMALVGSLVFFLIEVLYVGDYQARLNYAFALFVFAAVLIARISIEMGSERAAVFALPLGIVMFLVLVRFVEQPSAFSSIINLALMCLVWWSADRLTWDSTVIDDAEDASGEGLMQRIGVDELEEGKEAPAAKEAAIVGTKDNELVAEGEGASSLAGRLWHKFFGPRSGPHTPGVWVFYFSMAALPLFGIGQHWIPAAAVGRRRYAFGLLLVYVAAALSLLVTTSFLNLRRYLRQRHVEMPATIAGTWVGVGAVLIVVVMLLAALIPRPNAEIAMSRVPWQAGSPGGMSASRMSVNRDGGEEQNEQQDATGGEKTDDKSGGQADQGSQQKSERSQKGGEQEKGEGQQQGEGQSSNTGQPGDSKSKDGGQEKGASAQGESKKPPESAAGEGKAEGKGESKSDGQEKAGEMKSEAGEPAKSESSAENAENKTQTAEQSEQQEQQSQNESSPSPPSNPLSAMQNVSSMLGGLAGLLKLLFYAVVALAVGYGIWKYRHQLMQALADILRSLRELFGGKPASVGGDGSDAPAVVPRRRTFAEFNDPFVSGQHGKMPPAELVRYTFAAFEAWANDRGRPRDPDVTPQELVRLTVAPDDAMYAEARRLTRLYGEAAYASAQVPRSAANELRGLWQLMRESRANGVSGRA